MPSPRNAPLDAATAQRLALAAGVTPRQVRKDKDAGAPLGTPEGYIAWRAANRVHRSDTNQPGAQGQGINHETARLRRVQADREELELAKSKGELMHIEDVRQVVLAANVVFASQLEALPGRLANELAALTNPALILAKLRDECRRVREAVANEFQRLADDEASAMDAASEGGASTAQQDSGSVGGPNTEPTAGQRGAGSIP